MQDVVDAVVPVDPFSFFPELASRIPGLGGPKVGHDPRYLFHTPYVTPRRGRASFTVTFDNVRAKRGTLAVSVNMFPLDARSEARVVTTERITLNRLIAEGSSITLAFESFRGMSFAILGQIPDDTDITADGLRIFLNNPPVADEAERDHDSRATAYCSTTVRPAPFITDLTAPLFADPVSQAFTPEQLREKAFARWMDILTVTEQSSGPYLWQEAYILQTLKRYGLLEPGARALGLAVRQSLLPAVLANRGLDVTATDPLSPDIDEATAAQAYLAEMASLVGGIPKGGIAYCAADPQELPGHLVNFDLMWSVGLLSRLGGIAAVIDAVENGLRCLRPGGIAVNSFEICYEGSSGELTPAQIERLALVLISKGHQIARLKFARPIGAKSRVDQSASVPFGLLVRKATSIF